jgi:hypothetical protein
LTHQAAESEEEEHNFAISQIFLKILTGEKLLRGKKDINNNSILAHHPGSLYISSTKIPEMSAEPVFIFTLT